MPTTRRRRQDGRRQGGRAAGQRVDRSPSDSTQLVCVELSAAVTPLSVVTRTVTSPVSRSMSMSMSIQIFSVAKIAELLLRSPQRRIAESQYTKSGNDRRKRNVLGVDGEQVGMEMIECQTAVSSIEVMQRRVTQ